ncbi:MAG: hypothetical protein AABY18_00815 [Candidatus Thermoplasmatota archaeon]
MTRRPLALTVLLLAAALAGCTSEDPKTDSTEVADDPVSNQLSEDVGTPVVAPSSVDGASLSVNTPFVLPATTGPDAPLTAFEWRIPDGAILEYQPYEDFDYTVEEIVFEVVPIFPDGNGSLDEFAILAVNFEDGNAYISSAYLGIEASGSMTGPLGSSTLTSDPELEPLRLSLWADSLEEGDRIGFVLMGRSAEPGTFGLLISPWAEPPEDDDDIADDAAELLQGRTPVTLEPIGTGVGFQVALYDSININFLTAIYHIEIRTEAATVEDRLGTPRLEPILTARDMTVSATFPGRGHSEAISYYFATDLLVPTCTSVVQYDIGTDLHGTAVQHRSVDLEIPAASLPTGLVTGSPILFAVGEGDGAATTSAEMQIATACGFEFLIFEQFDLGATLKDLTGTPAATGGAAYAGLVGNIPPMASNVDGDLVIRDGLHMQRLAGLGWLADPQSFLDSQA